MKREAHHTYTEEEDAIVQRYGSQMHPTKIAEMIHERTGRTRSIRSIRNRRLELDPAWDADPPGLISLHSISGVGRDNRTNNDRAIKKATDDGVIKRRLVGGAKRVYVPLWWADAWIAEEDANKQKYKELRDAGWMHTKEAAKIVGIVEEYFTIAMARLRKLDGAWRCFRDVECVLFANRRYLWEPNAMKAACATFLKERGGIPTRPKDLWGARRTAIELGVHRSAVKPASDWLIELGFDRLPIQMDAAGHFYWVPADVIAFREANAERLKVGWDRKRKRKVRV